LDLEQGNNLDVHTFETFTCIWTLGKPADYQASPDVLNSSSAAFATWTGGSHRALRQTQQGFPIMPLWRLKSSQSDES
jgi:hypothetical protein